MQRTVNENKCYFLNALGVEGFYIDYYMRKLKTLNKTLKLIFWYYSKNALGLSAHILNIGEMNDGSQKGQRANT